MNLSDLVFSHYILPPFRYDGGNSWKHVSNQGIKDGYFYYFPLEETIHYRALQTGDFSIYREYCKSRSTDTEIVTDDNLDRKIKEIKLLVENFDINKVGRFEVLPCFGKYKTIRDGIHRMAIMLHKGVITDTVPDEFIISTQQIVERELAKTVGNVMYNEWHVSRTQHGYHSFNIHGISIRGQRDCAARINEFRKHFKFENVNILDFGCNVGGMLIHAWECHRGLGVDYDPCVIEAARNISDIVEAKGKYLFIQHDFDRDDDDKLLSNPIFLKFVPDVIFILSLRGWVKNFALFSNICNKHKVSIFWEGALDMGFFGDNEVEASLIMENSFDDITGNYDRTTYFIKYLDNERIQSLAVRQVAEGATETGVRSD